MTGDTKLYGLIGRPLTHSYSAEFFNNKFAAEGIDAHYLNFELDHISQLPQLVAQHPQLCGLNVTAPYKEQVIPYLGSLDDQAHDIGAVNVIKFIRDTDGNLQLHGYNTDTIGFGNTMQPLIQRGITHALVLGTGGAARAVTHALQRLGITVQLVSRHKSAHTIVYPELTKQMVAACQLVVNATPLGKYPLVDQCPPFPYRFLTNQHLAYDLIYNPADTLFMRRAQQFGATTKNGLEMLLLQAFASYEVWTS